jgi:hypothetical protein
MDPERPAEEPTSRNSATWFIKLLWQKMKKKTALIIDAAINFVLGVLLLFFSTGLADFLGVPATDNFFYPNLLGAIFIGITIALVIEAYRKPGEKQVGLGLVGAICINLSGGLVLLLWLLWGNLNLPIKGKLFLWILDILLLVVSSFELFIDLSDKRKPQ